jgi:hypothetical protein
MSSVSRLPSRSTSTCMVAGRMPQMSHNFLATTVSLDVGASVDFF